MKKTQILILFLVAHFTVTAQSKKICITIDDLPAVSYASRDIKHLQHITNILVKKLNEHGIPAIGYVNEGKLYTNGNLDSTKVDLLETWFKNGLELGNHTYSHLNYHNVTLKEFGDEIVKGEKVIKSLALKYDQDIKYFRHPYLRIGKTEEDHSELNTFLTEHGYIEAPVTVDNSDYLFAKAYYIAYSKGDSALMKKIGQDYIDNMKEALKYFEELSMFVFDRPIQQTLLIHANLLNAHHMDDIANMLANNGYSFVSQGQVLEDKAYQTDIPKYGNWGISWLERWGMKKSRDQVSFKEAPTIPDYIAKMSR